MAVAGRKSKARVSEEDSSVRELSSKVRKIKVRVSGRNGGITRNKLGQNMVQLSGIVNIRDATSCK